MITMRGFSMAALATLCAGNVLSLDANQNGLYEPEERKTMLEALQAMCPELGGIVFDADGDGRVTVPEQEAGRHPLSQLVTRESVAKGPKIPWAIDLFSEWMMSAYFQEDVAVGAVSEHPTRGILADVVPRQEAEGLRPVRRAEGTGVEFASGSGAVLTMKGQRDARWNYRWCVLTFRVDGATDAGRETVLVDINAGRGPSKSSPRITYSAERGLAVQYVGRGAKGLDVRVMRTKDVVADGKTWNVLVCGLRQGRLFASVNGRVLESEVPQPSRYSTEMVYDTESRIGDAKGGVTWAYDALVLGQTELTEAMVEKLSGWAAHRLKAQAVLPVGHVYRERRPVLDAEDLPHRYVHDHEAWTAWGERNKDKGFTRVNAGGERVEPQGFERVFYDDFRAFRLARSTSGEGDLWQASGFNTAVGGDAKLLEPGRETDVYPYDAEKGEQTLSLAKAKGRWWGSAFYSVNDMGQGYTWMGPKVFRIRCKFPKMTKEEIGGGLFPAFWSYGMEFLFWRTSNRIECDWFEFDGKGPTWLNGLSSHYHYTHVKSVFPKQNETYQRYKLYGGNLTEEKGKIPGGLFVWDGEFHTWEYVVDREMTYINVTVPDGQGGERFVEICRGGTAPTYLEKLDLQLDYALKAKEGLPKDDSRQDFVVDWVEVLQKTEDVRAVPAVFSARPVLEGTAKVGERLRCQANLRGITDVRYYWFADGYPLTYGAEPTLTLTAAESGKAVRCKVLAAGALDQPEAWTEPLWVSSPKGVY